MASFLDPVKGFGLTFATMFKKATTESYPEDVDPASFFRGLPDDRCQCAHWGVVQDGQITFRCDDLRGVVPGHLVTLLLDNDIEIHAQVVLCPGINDGAILEKTLRDLAGHYPKVISAAASCTRLCVPETSSRLTKRVALVRP